MTQFYYKTKDEPEPMRSFHNIQEVMNAMDELKSLEGCELDLIKRGVDQLALVLEIKEKKIEDLLKEIETYKTTIAILTTQLKNNEQQISLLTKTTRNQNQYDSFLTFLDQ